MVDHGGELVESDSNSKPLTIRRRARARSTGEASVLIASLRPVVDGEIRTPATGTSSLSG
jgi:hypothetical protein